VNGAAASSRRFAVVIETVGFLGGSKNVGVAVVSGIELLLSEFVQMCFHLLDSGDGESEGEELAAFFFVETL
jgi:hypothetical protein